VDLLRETADSTKSYARTQSEHNCWEWHAPCFHARQRGSTLEEAGFAAERYVDELLFVLARKPSIFWRLAH